MDAAFHLQHREALLGAGLVEKKDHGVRLQLKLRDRQKIAAGS
jgi:hypothetical protein